MEETITIKYSTIFKILIITIIALSAIFLTQGPTANLALEDSDNTQTTVDENIQPAEGTENNQQPSEQQQSPSEQQQQLTSNEQPPKQQLTQEQEKLIYEYFEVAKSFFLNSPTYSFDGLPNPEVDTYIVSENEIIFKFKFFSSHPGYGFRTGTPLPEEKTYHSMLVIIKEGKLASAMTDNKYDEINKQYHLFNQEMK